MRKESAIPPIVSTDWVNKNSDDPKLVILDIRSSEEYKEGHILNAVNSPFPNWFVERDGLALELPETGALLSTIGSAGITTDSKVVVVNITDSSFPLSDAARVADMLIYVGVENAAILDGGHEKWVKEGKPVSAAPNEPKPVSHSAEVNEEMFVKKEYVESRIGKSTIIDGRTPDVYFGVTQEPFTQRPGHIPSARCLPNPWIWTEEGTYKDVQELRQMAAGVIGEDTSKEIIVYCGVGGYASAWWFVLNQVLGYTNVKIYNGAAQEWTRDPKAPVNVYRWD
ncbi:MAG: sulfurtransferase [Dehalococcoidia bacterium]